MRHRIFVYGTMREGLPNAAMLQRAGCKFLGHALYPEGHSNMVSMGMAPALVPGRGSAIAGEVWSIPTAHLRILDKLEGDFGRRRKVRVQSTEWEGTEWRAWAYFLPDGVAWSAFSLVKSGDWVAHWEAAADPPPAPVTKPLDASAYAYEEGERDKLVRLAEGAHLTVESKGGLRVTYTRKDGLLTVVGWADKPETEGEGWEEWETEITSPPASVTRGVAPHQTTVSCKFCTEPVTYLNGTWIDQSSGSDKCLGRWSGGFHGGRVDFADGVPKEITSE